MHSVIPELNGFLLLLFSNCVLFTAKNVVAFKSLIMIAILFTFVLYLLFIFLFFREIRLDHKRYLEADRLGDEHILREVERFLEKMKQTEGVSLED